MKRRPPPPRQQQIQADPNPGIVIQSLRPADPDAPEEPSCLITWEHHQAYATVADVRRTAEDLFACAAWADQIGELLRMGLEGPVVTEMMSGMLASTGRTMLGTKDTLSLIPGGSSKRKAGIVLISCGPKLNGSLSPDGAREMARVWFSTAEATDSDHLITEAVRTAAGEQHVDAVFAYLQALRTDPELALAQFRATEDARAKALYGTGGAV